MADQPVDKDTDQPLPSYPAPPPSKMPLPRTSDDSSDVDTFVGRFDAKTDALGHMLAGIEEQRGEAEQKSFSAIDKRLSADRAQMQRAFDAEAAGPSSLPPMWNANKEREARIRTPIEDFGSIGSIFGIIASAFTKQPMVSALTASAAAMNAIRDHDEEGYKSAYDAWKENTQLAIKRFDMEHTMIEDANKFLDTDMSQWKLRQAQIAAQFDNQKTIAMLDAGMDKELLEAQAAQLNARDKLQDIMQRQEDYDIRRTVFQTQVKEWDKNHPDANPYERAKARLEILQGIATGGQNVTSDLLRQYRLDNPKATAEDQAKFLESHSIGARGGIAGGAGSTLTKLEGELAQRIENEQKTGIKDPVIPMLQKAISDAKAAGVTTPGGKKFDAETQVRQYDESLKTIDDNIKFLENYVGGAGIAGRATRLGERVEDIFGSDKTARTQFMRNTEYLRAAAGKLLFDRSGRPLAADAERIDDIIGGISLGDTTANTIRSLKEIKKRYQELQSGLKNQISGNNEPSSEPEDDSGSPAWEEAPIVSPTLH